MVHSFLSGGPNHTTYLLERVIDALDAVLLHAQQEAARQLRPGGPGVEQGGGRVREQPLRHEVVGLDRAVDVGLRGRRERGHEDEKKEGGGGSDLLCISMQGRGHHHHRHHRTHGLDRQERLCIITKSKSYSSMP